MHVVRTYFMYVYWIHVQISSLLNRTHARYKPFAIIQPNSFDSWGYLLLKLLSQTIQPL